MRQGGGVSTMRDDEPDASGAGRLPLPERAGDTSPERPWPVRHLAP